MILRYMTYPGIFAVYYVTCGGGHRRLTRNRVEFRVVDDAVGSQDEGLEREMRPKRPLR